MRFHAGLFIYRQHQSSSSRLQRLEYDGAALLPNSPRTSRPQRLDYSGVLLSRSMLGTSRRLVVLPTPPKMQRITLFGLLGDGRPRRKQGEERREQKASSKAGRRVIRNISKGREGHFKWAKLAIEGIIVRYDEHEWLGASPGSAKPWRHEETSRSAVPETRVDRSGQGAQTEVRRSHAYQSDDRIPRRSEGPKERTSTLCAMQCVLDVGRWVLGGLPWFSPDPCGLVLLHRPSHHGATERLFCAVSRGLP